MKKIADTIPHYLQKEATFINRQRELQQLHRQLQGVLSDMNKVSPMFDNNFGFEDDFNEEEDFDALQALNKTEISPEQEIRLLIREIQQLQIDVEDVRAMLTSRCKGSKKTKVATMVQQLSQLEHILEGQLYRAEKLIE